MTNPDITLNVFANTAAANAKLVQVNTVINNFRTTAPGAAKSTGLLGKSMSRLGTQVAGVAAAYIGLRGAMGAVRQLVGVNMEYEDSMAQVRAVTEQAPGFTEEAFGKMQEEARRLGATTRFSAGQAAEGLKFLGMAGFTAEEATASLESTLKLAQAGNIGLGQSADIVSNILTQFGASASDTERFANALAITAASTNTDILQLGEGMKYVGTLAGGMGKSVEETAAAMGVLGNSGVQASMAGTSLRGVMVQLADSNSKAYKSLVKMGVAEKDLDVRSNSLVDIFQAMKDGGLDAGNAYALFGARAGVAADVLSSNIGKFKELNGTVGNSEGALDTMAATMDDTFKGSVLRVKSVWEEFMLTLGESGIMNGLRDMMDGVAGVIGQMSTAVVVLKNAFKGGTLGDLFFTTLKLGAAKAVNFITNALLLRFKITAAYFTGWMSTITKPEFWNGMFNAFASIGFILRGTVAKVLAELIAGTSDFVTPLAAGLVFMADKFRAGLMIAGTSVVDVLLKGVEMVLTKLSAVSEIFGVDLDGAIEKVKEARGDTQTSQDEAKALFQKSFADTKSDVEAVITELPAVLQKAGDDLITQGKESFAVAKEDLGTSVGNGVFASVRDAIVNFKPSEAFDTSDLEAQLAGLIGQNAPDSKEGEKGKLADRTAAVGPNEEGGEGPKTAAFGGSVLGALNTILGKSANEVIAANALKQTKAAEETRDATQETRTILDERLPKGNGGTTTAVFG